MATRRTQPRVFAGDNLRAIAMPLGGIGTGSVALCGDGSLRQWQLCNNVNHSASVPNSFFAIRVQHEGQPPITKVLQSGALYHDDFAPVPSCNDYAVPRESKQLLTTLPGVIATEFTGEYPIAEIRYLDTDLPIDVFLAAYSPFSPLDPHLSGLPAVCFEFTVHNPSDRALNVQLAATLQNFVGWDGIQEIVGNACPQFGGNQNHAIRLRSMGGIAMQNAILPANHPKNGSLCLAALHKETSIRAYWHDVTDVWADFERDGAFEESNNSVQSPAGQTVNAAIAVPVRLEPGNTATVNFVLSWYFPNRYVDWGQWYSGIDDKKSLFWQGNAYNTRFDGAVSVAEFVRDNFANLNAITHKFRETFFDSSLPYEILDTVSSQMSIIRTPTCLWTEDGRFHAYEGCGGASTGGWHSTGGCCPMNCTHVWAYEMSLAALFPSLERTMRETELFAQLHPTGYLPHRVTLPLYLPRPWEKGIGGPDKPALDGLLSMILKTYREHKRTQDPEWLHRAWPKVKSAIHYIMTEHDTLEDGVLRGEQPNTYDISIFGPNTFMGTLYLAALRAGEEMALLEQDQALAGIYHARFELGSRTYDELLWNGDYWIQIYDAEKHPEQNWGTGCHSDQLFGQWWAYVLGLGDLLPSAHIQAAVKSIVKYNFREDFVDHKQWPREFVSDDDQGLLICTWPIGGRPKVPTLYSDEVWTGIEYEVAALCLYAGLPEECLRLLAATRSRYNGKRRNPWNDIECGDHYARAMSSWALLEAACGYHYDAATATLAISPRLSANDFRAFFLTATAWGSVSLDNIAGREAVTIRPDCGELILASLETAWSGPADVEVFLVEERLPCKTRTANSKLYLDFTSPVRVPAESYLIIRQIPSGIHQPDALAG